MNVHVFGRLGVVTERLSANFGERELDRDGPRFSHHDQVENRIGTPSKMPYGGVSIVSCSRMELDIAMPRIALCRWYVRLFGLQSPINLKGMLRSEHERQRAR